MSEIPVPDIVYLVEWRRRKTGWSELGPGLWEVDHNSGIWFTKRSAESAILDRQSDGHIKELYEMRVSKYMAAAQQEKR